ncbi:MAG TPA: UvrD-helicase domain-containing protein [Kineosporiaceae bacterium]|nr:UvrD-helicase domain-containing protein [Kineosporiaceae bacterium]
MGDHEPTGVQPGSLPEPGGASAWGEVAQLGLQIDGVQRQLDSLSRVLRELRARQGRFHAGAVGEQRVVGVLVDLVDTGWNVLPDRRWPGTRRANIDVLLAGPGGVFVVDVKTWRDVRVEHGRLWRGQADADDATDKLQAQAEAVRSVLVREGLAPAEVVPLLVLTGRRKTRAVVGEIQVLGEFDLGMDLLRRGVRLSAAQVEQTVAALERACPPAAGEQASARAARPRPVPRISGDLTPPGPGKAVRPDEGPDEPAAEDVPAAEGAALWDLEQVWSELVRAAAAEPIESWMTWLHPSQARLITRTWNGPARIRGPAGTGKTVVALHRARYLAQRGRRVLFASYVNSLGPVFRGLFTRMAPELTDRVDFASVHQVAARLLHRAGAGVDVAPAALDSCWARAWAATHRDGVLDAVGHSPRYWRDEITHVIKGRGIEDFEAYARLDRVGRHTRLQPVHREAVWRLFTEYERRRLEQGLIDWDDVLTRALQAVRAGTVQPGWDAVIVDEVQDLTCTGLRLLHALAGDGPDGLLLVGDGQQSVYPGGFTLAEAGISVAGRAVVLDRNYRNGAEILRHALTMLGEDTFDDLDPAPADPHRQVHTTRPGGMVAHVTAADPPSQEMALLQHLETLHDQHAARHGDTALLVATNRAVERWSQVLTRAGIPVVPLTHYDGHTVDAVKVGTFERGKGLDFAHVLIPDTDRTPDPRRRHESDDAYTERARLERRRLYVGITRARDTLWLGTTQPAREPPPVTAGPG